MPGPGTACPSGPPGDCWPPARDDCTRQAASGGPPAAGITGRTSMPRPFPACPSGPGASCVWTCRPAVRARPCPCVCAPVWIPPAPSWSTTPCAPPASPRHKNSIPESQEKFFLFPETTAQGIFGIPLPPAAADKPQGACRRHRPALWWYVLKEMTATRAVSCAAPFLLRSPQ